MIIIGLQYFSEGEEIELDNVQIEEEIRDALSSDDVSEVNDLVEKYQDYYVGNLDEMTFRIAVQESCFEYVEENADDIELNDLDAGASSSYLNETDDSDMIDILIDHGALRSMDDYSDFAFATDTVSSTIISFDPRFQKMVIDKLFEVIGMTESEVAEAISNDNASDVELPESIQDMDMYSLADACDVLLITSEDGEIEIEEFDSFDDSVQGWTLRDLIKKLGWDMTFEGTRNRFEETGVYFIKRIPVEKVNGTKTWNGKKKIKDI